MTEDEAKREMARQDYAAQTAEAAQRLQYQIDYSKMLLNALTVGNGGAILALLTFIGNTGAKTDPAQMKWAFGIYGAGLVLVFLSYTGAFFSQSHFYEASQHQAWNDQAKSVGATANNDVKGPMGKGLSGLGFGVLMAMLSLAAFIGGSIAALTAIT